MKVLLLIAIAAEVATVLVLLIRNWDWGGITVEPSAEE